MSLDDVPSGADVFIDSTILHYAFVEFGEATRQCVALLKRVASGEVSGAVSVPVLNDAVHKVMCSEAQARFAQPRAGLVSWMKDHPERVRELTQAGELLRLIAALPVRLLPTDLSSLEDGQRAANAHGLLASDAMILGLMLCHGLTHLATNDDDFDRVPGLRVWKPR